MSIRPQLIALALAASLATVAGCSSSSDAGASPTSTTTPGTSTSAAPSSPSETTPSPPTTSRGTAAGAPGVPQPARQHTKAGAIAFANYYTDKVNALGLKPRKGALEALSLNGCKTCHNFIGTINDNVRSGHKFDANQMIRMRSFSPYVDPSTPSVWVVMKSPEVHIIDSKKKIIQSFPKYPTAALVFHLKWTAEGWRTAEAKGDKSVKE